MNIYTTNNDGLSYNFLATSNYHHIELPDSSGSRNTAIFEILPIHRAATPQSPVTYYTI